MKVVLLAPHNDDAELFASAQLVLYQPDVVVVFRSHVQELRGTGITSRRREAESAAALQIFGCHFEQWEYLDSEAAPSDAVSRIKGLAGSYDLCVAPAVEEGGHEQHNQVGRIAVEAFGEENMIRYLTYRRGYPRSEGGTMVELTPETIAKKHLALACHLSQIEEPSTRSWFTDSLNEWVA